MQIYRLLKRVILALLILSYVTLSAASTATTTLNVSGIVTTGCIMTKTQDIAFGTVSVASPDTNSTGALSVTCPGSTNWTLYLTSLHSTRSTTTFVMAGTAGLLEYYVYTDSGRTNQYTNSGSNPSYATGTGTGVAQSVNVYAKLAAADIKTAALGSYTDTITATLTW